MPELTPEEEFDKAFEEVTSQSPPGEDPGNDDSADDIPQSDDTPTGDEEGAPAEESDPDGEEPDGETDYKALYEKEVQRNKSWEGRIRAANQRAEEAERAAAAAREKKVAEEPLDKAPAPADDPELESFFDNYPELKAPFNKLVDIRGEQIARKIVHEEIQKLTPELTEIKSKVQSVTAHDHFARIAAVHPDYQQVAASPDLISFIEEQPAFVRDRYQEIADKGSTEDVIELLTVYKQSRAQSAKGEPPAKQKQSKAAKAAALEAVPSSKAHLPKGGPDKDDFDAGWEDAIRGK